MSVKPAAGLEAFVTAPAFEAALVQELGLPDRVRSGEPRWPSVVTSVGPVGGDPVFALQRLPGAQLVQGESVNALVEAAFAVVDPVLDGSEDPFVVHAFVPNGESYRSIGGRARTLGEVLLERLRERRRRTHRRHREALPWGDGIVVQLAAVGRASLLVSAARPRPLTTGGFDVSPWPGGLAPVAEDKTAPSRAYGKLEESFAWLGATPGEGETVVDLGGSPGGWAWKALTRGASVVAVDRSPLLAPALGHPRLSMVLGNAFTFTPSPAVDWLLCDVICEPARTFELVERWMAREQARHIVATLKFKGREGYALIEPGRARLAKLGWPFLRIKHMARNHNEAMILARR